jgi:hypothetical protein
MIVLPPLLPELDGGRPTAGSLGPAAATIRLGARVIAIAGADAVIETAHGRVLLQECRGCDPVRPFSWSCNTPIPRWRALAVL